MKYEYMVKLPDYAPEIEACINTNCNNGWELFSITTGRAGYIVTFRRVVEPVVKAKVKAKK